MTVIPTRRDQIVQSLGERIRTGELRSGERLSSEAAIATEFGVSRGTVRQALQELQREDLIATRAGLGSFVTFDGAPLENRRGWTRALLEADSSVSTEELGIEISQWTSTHGVPAQFIDSDAVVVRRRRLLHDQPISFERATIPAIGTLAELSKTGLAHGSLTESLRQAGLVAHHGTHDVRVSPLTSDVAELLGRRTGELFLCTLRVSYTRAGVLMEHVESFLDPEHFRLHIKFGEEGSL